MCALPELELWVGLPDRGREEEQLGWADLRERCAVREENAFRQG